MGAVLKECGLPHTGSLLALSYVDYGQKLEEPMVGAIATKKREGGGHVFFVSSFDKKFIYGLGGNQHDEVSIVEVPALSDSLVFLAFWCPPTRLTFPINMLYMD